MPKILLRLDAQTEGRLAGYAEAGMGFYIVKGRIPGDDADREFLISGDNYLVPLADPKFFALADLLEGEAFPVPAVKPPSSSALAAAGQPTSLAITSALARHTATLPPGYQPAAGAVPLLGTATLGAPTPLYRYTGSPNDLRFTNGSLAQGSYLTTELDRGYANSGFAAVGRYALPLPVPASFVHVYVLPQGTTLRVGTALPSFGQAGGGVEVKLTANATPVVPPWRLQLEDF
ncbi:MAG TPA: hypothetical protein VJA16_02505 [Thermoanaerobaculia bacterium]